MLIDIGWMLVDIGRMLVDIGWMLIDIGRMLVDIGRMLIDIGWMLIDIGRMLVDIGWMLVDIGWMLIDISRMSVAFRRIGVCKQILCVPPLRLQAKTLFKRFCFFRISIVIQWMELVLLQVRDNKGSMQFGKKPVCSEIYPNLIGLLSIGYIPGCYQRIT